MSTTDTQALTDAEIDDFVRRVYIGQGPRGLMMFCRQLLEANRERDLEAAALALAQPAPQELTEDDVFTLMGHAGMLRGEGQNDMPTYFFGLAERIAKTRGDHGAAKRVRDVATAQGLALPLAGDAPLQGEGKP